jgi:hypothetical protein
LIVRGDDPLFGGWKRNDFRSFLHAAVRPGARGKCNHRRPPSLMLINTVIAMDLMASASKRTT